MVHSLMHRDALLDLCVFELTSCGALVVGPENTSGPSQNVIELDTWHPGNLAASGPAVARP